MAGADALFFPSRAEGLGMVAVEAQAAGVPVLASTGVPRECVVVPELVRFLDLDAGAGAWRDELLALGPGAAHRSGRGQPAGGGLGVRDRAFGAPPRRALPGPAARHDQLRLASAEGPAHRRLLGDERGRLRGVGAAPRGGLRRTDRSAGRPLGEGRLESAAALRARRRLLRLLGAAAADDRAEVERRRAARRPAGLLPRLHLLDRDAPRPALRRLERLHVRRLHRDLPRPARLPRRGPRPDRAGRGASGCAGPAGCSSPAIGRRGARSRPTASTRPGRLGRHFRRAGAAGHRRLRRRRELRVRLHQLRRQGRPGGAGGLPAGAARPIPRRS